MRGRERGEEGEGEGERERGRERVQRFIQGGHRDIPLKF